MAAKTLVPPSPPPWRDDKARKPSEWGVRARPAVVDWDGRRQARPARRRPVRRVRGEAEQTADEAAEEKDATGSSRRCGKEWAAAYKEFAALSDAPEPSDPKALEAHRLADRPGCRTKIALLKDEITRLQDAATATGAGYMSHGYVWLFRRIAPAK